jgi:hypothetical protein
MIDATVESQAVADAGEGQCECWFWKHPGGVITYW